MLEIPSYFRRAIQCRNVVFSQANLLYHFYDFTYDQFNYVLPWSVLDYDSRKNNMKKLFEDVKADYTCLVEWNGNPLSAHYIDKDQEVMKGKIKEVLLKILGSLLNLNYKDKDHVADEFSKLVDDHNDATNTPIYKRAIAYLEETTNSEQDKLQTTIELIKEALTRTAALDLRKEMYFFNENYVTDFLPKKQGDFLPMSIR